MSRTWRELLADASAMLMSAAVDGVDARDARRIVEEASGYEGADLVLHLDDPAPARGSAYAEDMARRRAAGEPLQYVLGRWGFRSLDLMVDARVLIPRPETEEVAGWAIEEARALCRARLRAADLGTGSGAIAIALAVELRAEVWATDVSPDALDVARANLAGAGMWAGTRVRMTQGSWWEALPASLHGGLDVVVSNPPYVREDDPLPAVVADHEPIGALRAGPDGLDAIREIVGHAGEWLTPGGILVVEMDPRQAADVVALAEQHGANRATIRVDALGRDRALVAWW